MSKKAKSKDEFSKQDIMASMESINQLVTKERNERKEEKAKFLLEIGNLKKNIETLNNNIKTNENEYNNKIAEKEEKYKELLEKLKNQEEINGKLKEENELLKKENEKLNKLKEENEKIIKENKQLLENIQEEKIKMEKEFKQKIDDLNKEKLEIEKENNKNLELINKTREEETKLKNELEKKELEKNELKKKELEKKEEKINKEIDKEKSISINNETSKLLIEIVSDYAFRIINQHLYINVFDYIEQCEQNYDLLNFFSQLNPLDNYSIDDYLLKFFNNLQSYINIKGNKASLDDLLIQKSFKLSQTKPNIEFVKKIMKLNIGNEKKMMDICQEKKNLIMKSISASFESIKNKIEKNKNDIPIGNNKTNFLKMEKSNKNLTINMNEINMFKFLPLFKYQLLNLIHNVQTLTIITSSSNILLLYDILLYSEKLSSLKLIGSFNENLEENNNTNSNISLLSDVLPIIIKNLKKLTSFSISHIPIEKNIIDNLKDNLIYSNITSLGLSYIKIPENKFKDFSSYFKNNTKLTELDLSGYNYDILSTLNDTLFQIDNNLTSLTLSDNNLNDNNIKMIYDILLKNQKIKILNLSKNKLENKSYEILGEILNNSKTLEEINLSSCGLTKDTISLLINEKGSMIKKLYLDNNEIGDIGLVLIGSFIQNAYNLSLISLKNISGSDMGLNIIITNTLNCKSPLKDIHIERNKLITETLINEIIKHGDKFEKKGIVFYTNASCVKNKGDFKFLKLVE